MKDIDFVKDIFLFANRKRMYILLVKEYTNYYHIIGVVWIIWKGLLHLMIVYSIVLKWINDHSFCRTKIVVSFFLNL